jgi:curved DNA-binding protein CbpA
MVQQMTEVLGLLMEPDYYACLAVSESATLPEIEHSYKNLSVTLNLNQREGSARIESAGALLNLAQAFEILSDPILRSQYDIRRFGRQELPLDEAVQKMFKSGVKAYREHQLDLALRCFKEAVRLYPHRALFRVHLAIVFAEKNWLSNAESELETALRLDPEDRFAKETIARLIFSFESYSREPREPREPLLRRVGTGLLKMVRTGPLNRRTGKLDDKDEA